MKDLMFLEEITAAVHSQDTQKRLKAAEDLTNYLNDPSSSVEFLGFDKLLDGIVTWINSSNYRISVAGLDLLHHIVDHLGKEFRHHLLPVVPGVIERLGDSKQQVRDLAQDLLQKFMSPVSSPQHVLEQVVQGFGHKSWRVREEVLLCLVRTINSFGASSVTISKFVPHICKLLGDPNSQVRDRAINTLVEIYRHVGEKVRIDLAKKGIPSSRLSLIYSKFDEVARSGTMVVNEDGPSKVNGEVETDGPKMPPRPTSTSKRSSVRKTSGSSSSGSSKGAAATGAVDETDFAQAFEETPEVRVFSGKELSDEMTQIQTILSDSNNDWEKRVAALRKVRGLVLAGALEQDNFLTQLKLMEGAFKLSAKDLRSTVVREACITIAFLSSKLKNQFDHTAEAVFPTLVNLIPNSAKIMATCGDACIRIIIKNTHAHRLIPIITQNFSSKSSVIRRRMAEYMDLFLQFWSTSTMKGHVYEIEQGIIKILSDADAEARAAARRAFWRFAEHYRDKADSLLKSLDSSKQKQLENDRNLTNVGSLKSSSTSRFSTVKPTKSTATRSRTPSTRSDDGLSSRSGSSRQTVGASSSYGSAAMSHRDAEPRHAVASKSPSSGFLAPMPSWGRSLSNIDQRAASRANSRAKTSRTATQLNSNRTTPLARQSRIQAPIRGTCSQPGSRTQSPDRLFTQFSPRERSENYCKGVSPVKSKIPTPRKSVSSRSSSRASSRASSRTSSRGTSPERGLRRMSSGERSGYSPSHLPVLKRNNASSSLYNPPGTKALHQGDIPKGDVTEAAVWDAWTRSPARRKYSFGSSASQCSDDEPDDDAASVSSERSFGSRGSRNASKECQEVSEIVRLCNSSVWNDRRDGVTALQAFLKSSRVLSQMELTKIKDALTRLFFDPHNKVYSQYLDALCDFIVIHKVDLQDWLFVLLSRLLSKLGTDILSSLQSKIVRVLDVVRDSFPYDLQFSILTRFITDQTQTPNLKVKIAVLQYLQGLISLMDPSDFTNSGETRLAVSRIITWTTEPKSGEVRKESAAVIVALFELNTPEFSMMLSSLPKSFQDGATKLLHNHLKSNNSGVEPIPSSRAISSPVYNYDEVDRTGCSSPTSPRFRLGARTFSNSSLKGVSPARDEGVADNNYPETSSPERTASPRLQPRFPRGPSPLQRDNTTPRNGGSPLLRGSSLDSADTASDGGSPVPRASNFREAVEDAPSISSGYNSDGDMLNNIACETPQPPATNATNTPLRSPAHYDPKQYQGDGCEDFHPVPEMNGFVTAGKKKARDGEIVDELDRSLEGMDQSDDQFDRNISMELFDTMGPILDTLMSPGLGEEKRSALCELQKLIREDSPRLWDDSFKRVYEAVMKVVEDEEPGVRSLALRAVRDMVRLHPQCFIHVSHNTIAKVLEAHNDSQKEIVRLAEEAAMTIARLLPPDVCLRVLGPLLRDAEFPVNLAAIKMITKVIEGVNSDTVAENLSELIPGLVRCYDHAESSVRKASVFCLVAIHNGVGEEVLLPHLAELSGTKMKLLNLYIKRSQAANGGGR